MSPKFGLNLTVKPLVRDVVFAKCYVCHEYISVVFRELIRSTNTHLAIGLYAFHCKACLYATPEFRKMCSEKSKNVVDKITRGASERSKNLWKNDKYRQKLLISRAYLSKSVKFKKKVSAALKNKFATDEVYVKNVNAARFNDSSEFFQKCKNIHNDIYDYSHSIYAGLNNHITIICDKHGEFTQLACNHLIGHGCRLCAIKNSQLTRDVFINRCATTHSGKYNYSVTKYRGSLKYIEYICPIHGKISQLAQNHLKGRGCKYCDAQKTSSVAESQLADFVGDLVQITRNNRDIIGSELDIFVPSKNFAIEYHGMYWHSHASPETTAQKYKHYKKADLAVANKIHLLQIYESEWTHKCGIVKSIIRSKLNFSHTRYYARNLAFKEIDKQITKNFFDINHLYGHRSAKYYYGLFDREKLVAAASFNNKKDGVELIRFVSLLNSSVVGGLSKLLKNTTNKINAKFIFTYADRRYATKQCAYEKIGFKHIGTTTPGYMYCKGQNVFSRQMFQKHKLAKRLEIFDSNLTEAQNMFVNGYRRIWDAGHYKLMLYI